jgi:hypothetical protein
MASVLSKEEETTGRKGVHRLHRFRDYREEEETEEELAGMNTDEHR